MGTNSGQDPFDQAEVGSADTSSVDVPPELASLAPELADDPWEDWGSPEGFAPDLSGDGTPE